MSLPSTPADAMSKAGRIIGSLLGRAVRHPVNEEEQVLFEDQDVSPRSCCHLSVSIPPGAAGNGDKGGRASSESSSDSSSSDFFDNLRNRRSSRRHKKRRRRECDHRRSKGGQRYRGITDVLSQASKFVQDMYFGFGH